MERVDMYTCGNCLKPHGCVHFYIRKDTETNPPGAYTDQRCMFGRDAKWMGISVHGKDAPEIFRRLLFVMDGGDITIFDKKLVEETDRFSDLGD